MKPFILPGILIGLTLWCGEAMAHARLDHAEPKVGSSVSDSPTEVKIWFTDDVEMNDTGIEVFDSSGNRVDKNDLHADQKDTTLAVVSLKGQLASGKYKVTWHAKCHDQHKTHGEFTFEVK
jgi:methionine-rich copper-binding protein CopC